jgi:phosphohistidine phosphatase
MLLRHGEAASADGLADLDRQLTERGRNAAWRMGRYLAAEGLRPDLALISPARRARDTWALAGPALGEVPTRLEARIYESPPQRLLAIVREAEEGLATLLLVGHNPGLQDLLRLLLCDEERYSYGALIGKYPPAGLAVVDLPARAWHEVSPRSGHLDRLVTPSSLGFGDPD